MIDSDASWKLFDTIKSIASSNGQSTNAMATCVRVLSDGTRMMQLVGSSILTPLNGNMAAEISQGDMAEVRIEDGVMSLTANVSNPSVGQSEVDDAVADRATVRQLGESNARIEHLEVTALTAESATIANLQADTAKVHDLTADQLTAATAYVGALDAGNVTAAQLIADHGTIGTLDTTYMHADMANADVAWIQNGTIKDGAIVSAMINDVSANKLTAGTINGSVINVTNLNADNITAGTINGQRIGEGSLSLSKLDESVYTEAEVNSIVDGLNDRIDGAIETFTGTVVPTLNNSPASGWNTTKLKDEHVGDVYYVVNAQSQQNGYCYRFTKSGSTYSWQLIKDSDVTAALSRLTTAEGKITTFDSDISTLKTTIGTLTTKTESLETRMSDAESDILDKVDTTTFNEVSDTVDQHSQTISQHTTAISNKADSSTVTAVTNRVSKNEQDISGINTTIGELQDTVETKADGSTVETVSNRLNTVSNTVDGHTQTLTSVQNTLSSKADSSTVSTLTTKVNTVSDTVDGHTSQLSSITSTQTSMQSTLNKTVKSSIQLWYSKANTTAPSKPTSQVTSTSTSGNAWRIVVPAYNASYPNYYYCWQYEYVDGTYGWSAVVRDIAMGESQATARTADSNASAAVTTANTANTNASTALTTANTANANASDAKTAATTASTTASEAKTTAETAASDASTAKTNAASAVSTANSASTTATNAQSTANANIKSSVQLWFTKANSTAPNKPTSVVSTSNANTANAWNLVVPVWNSSYPHYYYCYQQQKGDGTYQWTDVVYDRATSEAQQLANTTSTNLSTLQTNYATFKQTTEQFESTVGSRLTTIESDIDGVEERVSDNETSISNNASAIALKANSSDVYTKTDVDGKITQEVTDRNAAITAKANEITSSVSETYATKTAVNGKADASDVTALAGRVTTAESNITQNAQNIELKVSKDGVISSINQSAESVKIQASKVEIDGTAVFSAIKSSTDAAYDAKGAAATVQSNLDNIVIGGRNLLTGTDVWLTTFNSYSSCGKSSETIPAGSVVTVSVEVNADNLVWDTTSSTHRIGFETYLTKTGGGSQYFGVWAGNAISESSNVVEAFTGSIHKRISKTFTLLGDFELGRSGYIYTRGVAQGTVKVGRAKIEYGNRATDWSPSEGDIVKRTQRIWYRWNSATAPAAPSTWVTKGDDGSALWTKMHVAITSTHKYIYTCEQFEMADGTLGHTDVLLDNTITVIDGGNIITDSITANKLNASDINASKTLTVGAMTDAAAATILNSNLQVGGRNLLRNTGSLVSGSMVLTRATVDGDTIKLAPTTSSSYAKFRVDYLDYSDHAEGEYTLSFEYRVSDDTTSYTQTQLVAYIGFNVASRVGNTFSSSYDRFYNETISTDYSTEWTRASVTVSVPSELTTGQASALVAGSNLTVQFGSLGSRKPTLIRGIKLEKGNKATDWSPAPEDVDAAVSDAAKTATNYIVADSSGIKIADANPASSTTYQHQTSSGTDFVVNGGVRNRVNADGMTLYDGSGVADSNIFAKFASQLIELGRNSINSIIKLCNGVGKISVETGTTTTMRIEAESTSEINAHTYISKSALDLAQAYGAAIGGFIFKDSISTANRLSYATVTARDTGQVEIDTQRDDGSTQHLQFDDSGLAINSTKGIRGINFGFSSATTNRNGITTFNPNLGRTPTAVFVAAGKASNETEAVAKIAVPMVWSIDGATQVQVRWQRRDTNAWLTNNAVGWYWLALA